MPIPNDPDLSTLTKPELNALKLEVLNDIDRINVQLTYPSRTHRDGTPYTDLEFKEWRAKARYALSCAKRRLTKVKEALKKHREYFHAPAELQTERGLIHAAFQILDRIELKEDELPVRHALKLYLDNHFTVSGNKLEVWKCDVCGKPACAKLTPGGAFCAEHYQQQHFTMKGEG